MTRLEQLQKKKSAKAHEKAAKEQALLESLAKLRGEDRAIDAEIRVEQQKLTNKRRYHLGAKLDEAGLFALDNPTLYAVIAVLGRARQIPDLAQVLLQVLDDWLLPEEKDGVDALTEDLETLLEEVDS